MLSAIFACFLEKKEKSKQSRALPTRQTPSLALSSCISRLEGNRELQSLHNTRCLALLSTNYYFILPKTNFPASRKFRSEQLGIFQSEMSTYNPESENISSNPERKTKGKKLIRAGIRNNHAQATTQQLCIDDLYPNQIVRVYRGRARG